MISFHHLSLRMPPRRERRVGVRYVENDRDRNITFIKRHAGLFKSAADLTALTSAKVAIVVQTDDGKMHSFGTPTVDPIINSFTSGRPFTGPLTDEATGKRISWLERVVARLDKEKIEVEKQTRISIECAKQLQEEIISGTKASLLFSKDKYLNLEDLIKLITVLTHIQKQIQHRLPTLHCGPEPQNGAGTSAPQHVAPLGGQLSSWDHRSLLPISPPGQSSLSPLPPRQQSSMSPIPPPHVASQLFPPQHNYSQHFAMQQVSPPMETQHYKNHMMEIGSGSNGNAAQMISSTGMLLALPLPPSPLQSQNDQIQDQLPLPLQLHPMYFSSTQNTTKKPQIYPSPDPKFQQNSEDASPLLVHSGGTDFSAGDTLGDDHWAYALSDQPYYSELLGFDGYMGYRSTDVGLGDMENIGGWVDAPPVLGPCSGGDASAW